MKNHDKFIETYKQLETEVRDEFDTVRNYEESLSDDVAKKLQLCRLIRNYIQHNADYEKFIQISSSMQDFLEKQVYSLQCRKGVLKEYMLSAAKYGCIFKTDDVLSDVASKLIKKKRRFGIVVSPGNIIVGLIDANIVCELFGDKSITPSTKVSKVIDSLCKDYTVRYVDSSTPMITINQTLKDNSSDMIFLIANKKGEIVGVYNVE